MRLSRRSLFHLAGLTSVGLAPALEAFETAALTPFGIVEERDRLAFTLGGRERWVLDTRRFGGSPGLKVRRGKHRILVELRDALLPGTDLAADLACDLRPLVVGWRMELRLALAGFAGTVPFERWLAGIEPLRGSLASATALAGLPGRLGLELAGDAGAQFGQDWSLLVTGEGAAALRRGDLRLISDAAELSLLAERAASTMDRPATKRSLLSLQRGSGSWPLDWVLPAVPGADCTARRTPLTSSIWSPARTVRGIAAVPWSPTQAPAWWPSRQTTV